MRPAVAVTVEDGIARVVLDHPPLNILTRTVLRELRESLANVTPDRAARVVLLEARGSHFSAGADVEEHLPPEVGHMIPEFLETVRQIEAVPLPVVAAVRGRCLGGAFELVQAADMVVATDGAQFGQPEIFLGVFPPAACLLLPERCPYGAAAEMLLTGDPISAADARQLGLVQQVVEDEALEPAALALARRIARHSGAALRLTKRALHYAHPNRRRRFRDLGRLYTEELMSLDDPLEGLRAFREKRKPTWTHR